MARPEQPKHPDGTVVHKWFRGHGWFQGEVLSFDGTFYRIRYADGDAEECDEAELDALLDEAKLRPPNYAIGTEIQKEFPGHGWFRGRLSHFDGTYYKVYYEDGDEEEYDEKEIEELLHLASLRKLPKYPVGTAVKKFFQGHGLFRGTVASYNGIIYTVLYEDGDREQYEEKELAEIIWNSKVTSETENEEERKDDGGDFSNSTSPKAKRARTEH
jgi:hypothetical protein